MRISFFDLEIPHLNDLVSLWRNALFLISSMSQVTLYNFKNIEMPNGFLEVLASQGEHV